MHPTIQKWETALQCLLPENIWTETWIPGRAAKENTFLWLILFRAFATLSWRFPNSLSKDPIVCCLCCCQGLKEDSMDCIWQCASSIIRWKWCNSVLASVACRSAQMQIQPHHVIMALPPEWEVLFTLWRVTRAVICW